MKTTKVLTIIVGLSFLSSACVAIARGQVPAVTIGGAGTTDDDTDDVTGFVFTVGDLPIAVDELGFWDFGSDGLNVAHDVGIFRQSDQAIIVQGTVPAGVDAPLDGGFRYVSIPAITLLAGESYQAVAYRPAPVTDLVGVNFPTFSSASAITVDQGIFLNGTGGLAFATSNPGTANGVFGPNFKIHAIPEPSTLLLAALGLLGLLGFTRRRRK